MSEPRSPGWLSKNARFIPGLVVAVVNTALTIGGYENAALALILWIVAGLLLIGAAFPYLRRIRVSLVPENDERPGFALPGRRVRPAATPQELAGHTIVDRTIWVSDLLENDSIRERKIERCTVVGPALIAASSPGNEINRCSFVNALPDSSNILLPVVTTKVPEGAIKLERVSIFDCDLIWCSLVGTPEWVERTKREGFGGRLP